MQNYLVEFLCNHGESTVDYPERSTSSEASTDAV
jgi:hypothetical protein